MRPLFVAFVACVGFGSGACSGDMPTQIDANPAGPRCSMQLYDLCIEDHDCMTNICQNFSAAGFQVCSQVCAATTPCPVDKTGAAGTCESGACRPSAPNMCHL